MNELMKEHMKLRFVEFLHFDVQSAEQKSHRVSTTVSARRGSLPCFV